MTDYPESGQAVSSLPNETLYPLIPLRDIVIFPAMVTPLFVGRPRSIQALEAANAQQRLIFLTTQRDPKIDDPLQNDLYEIGVIGQIIQLLKLPDGTVKVLIEGKERARIVGL
ncbi:MAG: LON peptidase substrate-binding domain-containing protein, partial [Desulfuromonadales bacterium]|nr:LON peptidase substrate-binding domain-containing protein [Desulfuromonadales bacterium]